MSIAWIDIFAQILNIYHLNQKQNQFVDRSRTNLICRRRAPIEPLPVLLMWYHFFSNRITTSAPDYCRPSSRWCRRPETVCRDFRWGNRHQRRIERSDCWQLRALTAHLHLKRNVRSEHIFCFVIVIKLCFTQPIIATTLQQNFCVNYAR